MELKFPPAYRASLYTDNVLISPPGSELKRVSIRLFGKIWIKFRMFAFLKSPPTYQPPFLSETTQLTLPVNVGKLKLGTSLLEDIKARDPVYNP